MDTSTQPDVKSYLSALLFLQDYYQSRKKNDPQFSYQIWADQLQVTSKSYLRLAVVGKRKISEQLTQKFCQLLNLGDNDREYFCMLVLYTQSTSAEQKKIYGRKLTQLLKAQVLTTPIEPNEDFLANPLNMIIRNVLSFADINRSVTNLAKIFSISEDEMNKKLSMLEKNGLVQQIDSQWQALHDIVQVKAEPGNKGMLAYHKQSLLKAIDAQAYPVDQRNFRSLTLALNAEEFAEYQKDVNTFTQQAFSKFAADELNGRRIYQLNLNAIPWTAVVEAGC